MSRAQHSKLAVVCLLCLGLARLPAAAEVGERSPTRVGKPRRRASGPRGRRRQPRADLPSGIAQRSAYARVGGPRGGAGANASRRVVWPLRGTGRTYVHIVGTRFCLKQGHNAALVEARLLLFERICVPTMAQQSTNRFVWLVIVDETLAPRHRRRLTTLLAAHRDPRTSASSHSTARPPTATCAPRATTRTASRGCGNRVSSRTTSSRPSSTPTTGYHIKRSG